MSLIDVMNQLPNNRAIAFEDMLNELSEDDAGFLEEHFETGSELPSNIIQNINQAYKKAGYPQYNWDNYNIDTSNKRFDDWLD